MQIIYRRLSQVCFIDNLSENSSFEPFLFPTVSSPIQQPSFPELQNLSNDELENLRDDTDLQDKFIEALPQTVEVDKMIKSHMDKIGELASELCECFSFIFKIDKHILVLQKIIYRSKSTWKT